jgi:hypothetical protein
MHRLRETRKKKYIRKKHYKKSKKYRKKQRGGAVTKNPFILKKYMIASHKFYNNIYGDFQNCIFPCDQEVCAAKGDTIGKDCVASKRIPLTIPGEGDVFKQCENTNQTVYLKDYFADYTKNLSYLTLKYRIYFSLPPAKWANFIDKIQEGPKKDEKIILGPGELLIPFVEQGFLYLSHKTWTPNINFNYIIQILYKLREFWMIIPAANTVMDRYFSLISDCSLEGEEGAFKRVTLSELILLDNLQEKGYIKIETIDIDLPDTDEIKKTKGTDYYEIPFKWYKLRQKKNSITGMDKSTNKPCVKENTRGCYNPDTINSCRQDNLELFGNAKIEDAPIWNDLPANWAGCDIHPSFKFHMLYITPTDKFNTIIPAESKEDLKIWTPRK